MANHDEIPTTDTAQIEALIERLKQGKLQQHDFPVLERLLRLVLSLVSLLQQKNASIKRLKRLIFGPRYEKRRSSPTPTEHNAEDQKTSPTNEAQSSANSASEPGGKPETNSHKKGHGRMPASLYSGAKDVLVSHQLFKAGDHCPDIRCKGHLYELTQPPVIIHLCGQPLVSATRYHQQVLRCSACQERFPAALPEGVAPGKYDPTVSVALALAHYSAGMPFYRLARLQHSCGVPLPESTQFERCEAVANAVLPVYLHLLRLAADGEVFYTDDTRVVILASVKEDKQPGGEKNRATQTSGIVVKVEHRRVALYFSSRRHAGENLDSVLSARSAALPTPIQMSDALAANQKKQSPTIEANCLVHARRKFIEIEESFPSECSQVIGAIREVYRIEAQTKAMSDEDRLLHHKEHSLPVMEKLSEWIEQQFTDRKVEPNSALGKALQYLLNHWEKLTRFLTQPGAPIDNNLVERALKRFVLLRKNSLFYKTEHGAAVGDILMSLIETCRLNSLNAWDYLLCLVRQAAEVRQDPAAYLPWNYCRGERGEEETLSRAG
jgi:hypothetical protein